MDGSTDLTTLLKCIGDLTLGKVLFYERGQIGRTNSLKGLNKQKIPHPKKIPFALVRSVWFVDDTRVMSCMPHGTPST